IEPEEIPMEELARKTGYSLSSICLKLKLLESMGLVLKKRKPGSNRVYLFMEKDIVKPTLERWIKAKLEATNFLKSRLLILIEKYSNSDLDEKGKRELDNLKHYYQQVLKSREIYKKIETLLEDWME
ncbi:hypothetical protein KY318_01895, partial [Candidatus Woesearchaeota archaeon]|nr:hypothetical protein [Candidatus Woesearchaeota archaeon]